MTYVSTSPTAVRTLPATVAGLLDIATDVEACFNEEAARLERFDEENEEGAYQRMLADEVRAIITVLETPRTHYAIVRILGKAIGEYADTFSLDHNASALIKGL